MQVERTYVYVNVNISSTASCMCNVSSEEPQREFPHILPNQKELPARHMRDSYREVIIPLGQDHNVRDKYISFVKGMRFGRILEDLDSFAGEYHVCI